MCQRSHGHGYGGLGREGHCTHDTPKSCNILRTVYVPLFLCSLSNVIAAFDNRIVLQVPHPWPLCCLFPVRRDGTLLRLSKQATLQFVVVKPTMSILSLIALATNQYFTGSFQVCVRPCVLMLVYVMLYVLLFVSRVMEWLTFHCRFWCTILGHNIDMSFFCRRTILQPI